MIFSRPVSQHQQVTFVQGTVMRTPSPWFAPPYPMGMREPGTNYFTIITAPDPHTTESPGTTGGMSPTMDRRVGVAPLTRKGG